MLVRPIPDLQRFRNQCTGIGHTREASERTGAWRSRRVIDCAPPEQRKFAVGYPPPISDDPCVGVGVAMVQRTRR
jgi:hypothetical protein